MLLLVWCLAQCFSVAISLSFSVPNQPLPRPPNLQVDGQGRAFVTAGNQLMRLDSSLVPEQTVNLSSVAVNMSLSSGGDWLVVCTTNLSCTVHDANDLTVVRRTLESVLVATDRVAVFTAGNTFYVGSVNNSREMRLVQGYGSEESGRSSNFEKSREYTITRTGFQRDFFTGFSRGSNAYYIVSDHDPGPLRSIRVLRVCHTTGCPDRSQLCEFTALYEEGFQCRAPLDSDDDTIVGVSVVEDFAGTLGTSVLVSRGRVNAGDNIVCLFRLSDLDSNMDMRYDQCSAGTGDLDVAWLDGMTENSCSSAQFTDRCNFSEPLDDVSQDPIGSINALQLINVSEGDRNRMLASVAVQTEGLSLVVVAYTRVGDLSSDSTVAMFEVSDVSSTLLLDDAFREIAYSSQIGTLQWQSGLDCVLGASDVEVVSIPLENCATNEDCTSCVNSGNPLCGWCVLENKCSRQSQCRDGNTVNQCPVIPALKSVEPNVGFVRGGLRIVIRGDALSIGTDVMVFLDGASGPPCTDVSRNSTEIVCTTSDVPSPSTSPGVVVVRIDGQVFMNNSVTFTYHSDPVFTRLRPTFTIPAGGVNLTYFGSNFDIAQSIEISIEDSNASACVVVNSTMLNCPAPPLQTTNVNTVLSYSLMVDGDLFLDSAREGDDLQLSSKPDPEGFVLVTRTVLVDPSSPATIIIGGRNFNSVLPREFTITVGGQLCRITDINIAAIGNDEIDCTPPLNPVLDGQGRATVMVTVGTNIVQTLSGANGLLYITSGVFRNVILPAAIVPVIVVVLCVLVLLAVLIVWLRRKAKFRARERKQLKKRIQSLVMKGPISASRMNKLMEEFVQLFPAKLIIPSSQIRMLDIPLGQGQFGDVFKAQLVKQMDLNNTFCEPVAVKFLRGIYSPADLKNTMSEVSKMSELSHPNVMNLVGVCTGLTQGPGIVMPYMANGSVLDYLKKERKNLYLQFDADDETIQSVRKLLLRMCYQVSLGMTYLTLQQIVHRDLAARNCMLDSAGNIKVSDFGLSEDVYTCGYFRQSKDDKIKLPFKWMAPESLVDGIFTEKTDVWSFGVTCWEVFSCGRVPYPAVNPTDLPHLLSEGVRLEYPSNAANQAEIFKIVTMCWKESPDDRPTFEELCATLNTILQQVAGYLELSMVLNTPAMPEENMKEENSLQLTTGRTDPRKVFEISVSCDHELMEDTEIEKGATENGESPHFQAISKSGSHDRLIDHSDTNIITVLNSVESQL